MNPECFLGIGAPWIHVVTESMGAISERIAEINADSPRVLTRHVRGANCRTRTAMFDEVSAVLQFPGYFGHNWDAFDECLRDLSELDWGQYQSLAILISGSAHLLADEPPEALRTWSEIVQSAGEHWNTAETAGNWVRPPRAWHVFLQCAPTDERDLKARFSTAGANV
jgi:hypothetical protein